MENCKHIIGVLWKYDDTDLINIEQLCSEIIETENLFKYAVSENIPFRKSFDLDKYFDKRYSTNLFRFNYCPECGEKLNWKDLKDEAKNILNNLENNK